MEDADVQLGITSLAIGSMRLIDVFMSATTQMKSSVKKEKFVSR